MSGGETLNYESATADTLGAYVAVWRPSSYDTIALSRLVVLGSRCDEEALALTSFSAPSKSVTRWSDELVFQVPVYDEGCIFTRDKGNVLLTLIDGPVSTYGIDQVAPFSTSYSNTEFRLSFAITDYEASKKYAGSTATFIVLASSNPSGYYTRTSAEASFSITFADLATLERNTCELGTFNTPIF